MAALQADRLEEAWEGRAADLPIETPEEALILASIIEKETGVPEERDRVASVFVNRLRAGDAAADRPDGDLRDHQGARGRSGGACGASELDAATPYNTYVIAGLPPTPIANPGAASLQAAANPAETDAASTSSRTAPAGTPLPGRIEEHNANVARWRQLEAERRQRGTSDGAAFGDEARARAARDRAGPPNRGRLSRHGRRPGWSRASR